MVAGGLKDLKMFKNYFIHLFLNCCQAHIVSVETALQQLKSGPNLPTTIVVSVKIQVKNNFHQHIPWQ